MTTSSAARAHLGVIDTGGIDEYDSGGTLVTPSASIHTKGAYSTITSTALCNYSGVIVAFGSQNNVARTDATWLVDIAIGAVGSEKVVIDNIPVSVNSTANLVCPGATQFIPVSIPGDARLSARAQCSINDATDKLLDVVIYGVA
jgi:hypothetical protein